MVLRPLLLYSEQGHWLGFVSSGRVWRVVGCHVCSIVIVPSSGGLSLVELDYNRFFIYT